VGKRTCVLYSYGCTSFLHHLCNQYFHLGRCRDWNSNVNENATWCSKTVGGGHKKCQWCKSKQEFIKAKPTTLNPHGKMIWFCPICDNLPGQAPIAQPG
jgi:hypothetical protein